MSKAMVRRCLRDSRRSLKLRHHFHQKQVVVGPAVSA
jgi:hypothetical protein